MILTYEQWYDRCFKRGTSGEMCFDMLEDWREERAKLLDVINNALDSMDLPKYISIEECLKDIV